MLACPRAISETAQINSPAPRCGQDIVGWAKAHSAVPTIHAVLPMVGTLALCPPCEFGVLGRQNGRHSTTIPQRIRAREILVAWPSATEGRRECRVMASPMARLQTKKAGGSDHRLSRINHSLRNGVTAYTRPPRCPAPHTTPERAIPASSAFIARPVPNSCLTFISSLAFARFSSMTTCGPLPMMHRRFGPRAPSPLYESYSSHFGSRCSFAWRSLSESS